MNRPVDAADFKTYIFPLLFFKRLSDGCNEEHEAAVNEVARERAQASSPTSNASASPPLL